MTFGAPKATRFGRTVREEVRQMEQEFHEDDLELAHYFFDDRDDDYDYGLDFRSMGIDPNYDDSDFELDYELDRI